MVEADIPLGRSLIWKLQEVYFAERGIEAWRQGEVPHYVTNNPVIANCYAEIVFAFWRDRRRLAPSENDETLTICELGAGAGRFAFQFLRRLEALCTEAGVAPQTFRYVLTDLAEANLEFWRTHPNFEPFLADGRLDVARFDLTQPTRLDLQVAGKTIGPASLRAPLVVVANYFFDSIPQDLFYIKDACMRHCTVSLVTDKDPTSLDRSELLAALQLQCGYEPIAEPPYPEAWLNRLLMDYQHALQDTHLLLPAAGLRGLQHVSEFSQTGLLVLSADKGAHELPALDGRHAPVPTRHGSVSLPVNYHAFARFCEHRGGLALVPERRHASIDVVALLMLPAPDRYEETRHAYRLHAKDFGPDAFYSVIRHVRTTIPQMGVREILACLRLSRYDSDFCARCLARLVELAPQFDHATREDVTGTMEKVWENYFPLGEKFDLANRIANLFQTIGDAKRALVFYERSMAIYGPDTGTLCNIAACYFSLGERSRGTTVLHKVLEYEPDNENAKALLMSASDDRGHKAERR